MIYMAGIRKYVKRTHVNANCGDYSGTLIDRRYLLNKDLKYLVVLKLSFRSPLLQELLLSGTHYQTLSPRWLRYHSSEASCLLHRARRRAHSIAEISVRRLATIIQIQIQNDMKNTDGIGLI